MSRTAIRRRAGRPTRRPSACGVARSSRTPSRLEGGRHPTDASDNPQMRLSPTAISESVSQRAFGISFGVMPQVLSEPWFVRTRLKTRHLMLVTALHDETNLHRAAQVLGVTQPAASKL